MKMLCCIAVVVALMASTAACWAASDTTTQSFTASVAEIAKISVDGAVGTMNITNPATGGAEPAAKGSDGSSLRWTSVVNAAQTRTITAQVTNNEVPVGAGLYLYGDTPTTSLPKGVLGTAAAEVNLSKVGGVYPAQTIITGVGTGWTGTDVGEGSLLHYTFKVNDWSVVRAAPSRLLTVTYTLTDDGPGEP